MKYANTAPNNPMPATNDVPIPRLFFGSSSLTSVIPAPSSPANPIPATKRAQAYCSTFCTQPVMKLATEYNNIDPNKTLSRPRLSPITPQITPPINSPIICQLMILVLAASIFVSTTPKARRLGSRTIVNNRRS